MLHVKVIVLFVTVVCVALSEAEDLQVGSSVNNRLAYTENVKLSSVPLTTRTKNVFYNGNYTTIIKGVWAVDRDRSKAKVTITSGGVGSSFVNVRIKSEKGDGINYQVQVFV